MARRKKQPISEHRQVIVSAAQPLFMEKGIASTSMDDIAKAAGYSKATLYVYFKDKEEIVSLLVLDCINIDFETRDYLPEEKETYRIGEAINAKLQEFLISGIKKGDLRKDMEIMPSIFTFWGMLSGFIQLASNKEDYLKCAMDLSRNQFLEYGFDTLYRSIENPEVSQ